MTEWTLHVVDKSYAGWTNLPEKIKSVYDEVTSLFLKDERDKFIAATPKPRLSAQILRNDLRRCGLFVINSI